MLWRPSVEMPEIWHVHFGAMKAMPVSAPTGHEAFQPGGSCILLNTCGPLLLSCNALLDHGKDMCWGGACDAALWDQRDQGHV